MYLKLNYYKHYYVYKLNYYKHYYIIYSPKSLIWVMFTIINIINIIILYIHPNL